MLLFIIYLRVNVKNLNSPFFVESEFPEDETINHKKKFKEKDRREKKGCTH